MLKQIEDYNKRLVEVNEEIEITKKILASQKENF